MQLYPRIVATLLVISNITSKSTGETDQIRYRYSVGAMGGGLPPSSRSLLPGRMLLPLKLRPPGKQGILLFSLVRHRETDETHETSEGNKRLPLYDFRYFSRLSWEDVLPSVVSSHS